MVWLDKDDLRAGKSWQPQLAETIEKEADAFAVLLGASGVINWVEAEVEVALSRATTSAFPFIPTRSGMSLSCAQVAIRSRA
jgi:TIR domain